MDANTLNALIDSAIEAHYVDFMGPATTFGTTDSQLKEKIESFVAPESRPSTELTLSSTPTACLDGEGVGVKKKARKIVVRKRSRIPSEIAFDWEEYEQRSEEIQAEMGLALSGESPPPSLTEDAQTADPQGERSDDFECSPSALQEIEKHLLGDDADVPPEETDDLSPHADVEEELPTKKRRVDPFPSSFGSTDASGDSVPPPAPGEEEPGSGGAPPPLPGAVGVDLEKAEEAAALTSWQTLLAHLHHSAEAEANLVLQDSSVTGAETEGNADGGGTGSAAVAKSNQRAPDDAVRPPAIDGVPGREETANDRPMPPVPTREPTGARELVSPGSVTQEGFGETGARDWLRLEVAALRAEVGTLREGLVEVRDVLRAMQRDFLKFFRFTEAERHAIFHEGAMHELGCMVSGGLVPSDSVTHPATHRMTD